MKKIASVLTVVLFVIPLSACGGDDGGGDPQAYCDKVKEFETSGEQPSAAQGQELLAVAPAEIKGDIQVMTDALVEFEDTGDDSVLGTEEVAGAVESSTAWEGENC